MLKMCSTACAAVLIFTASPLQAKPAAWALTPYGLGPVKIGMTVKQVAKMVSAPIALDDGASGDAKICAEAELPGYSGVDLMFEGERLTSVTIRTPARTKTSRGIGIGDTEGRVKATHTPLEITGADYDDAPARNLTFWVKKNVSGIRFRTGHDRLVQSISVGGRSITYMEGCA